MRGSSYDLIVLWAATVGQVLFVSLWATQRWWESSVGKALMAKSASLAVILVASVWSYYHGSLPATVGRLLFTAVAAAIVWQFGVLVRELVRARREQRPVSGTQRNDQG